LSLWLQFEKAIQDYNQAIELNPKDADAFIDRGVAYAKLKQFEKAIQDCISSATAVKSISIP
jgi:regulator of sirC expression with transglutaminase-like and TPR domain